MIGKRLLGWRATWKFNRGRPADAHGVWGRLVGRAVGRLVGGLAFGAYPWLFGTRKDFVKVETGFFRRSRGCRHVGLVGARRVPGRAGDRQWRREPGSGEVVRDRGRD